jgi:hypothetical protein
MELYSGLDLHSRNTYIGILDTDFKRVFKKRVTNSLDLILGVLEPFKDQLKGIVVESTYNWYWLVDGLMDAGYGCVHLANPSAIKQYAGFSCLLKCEFIAETQHSTIFHIVSGNLKNLFLLPEKIWSTEIIILSVSEATPCSVPVFA